MTVQPAKRRSEKEGLAHFGKEMVSALLMALVAIVYVIQAFKIPTGSMEKSLMVGDFLLGLKFIYGAPVLPYVTYKKLPGITKPKPGDVIIFRYPGSDKKDYIKRCVAGPGQVIRTEGTRLFVDDREMLLPPQGQYVRGGQLDLPEITTFAPLRIPARGDVINADSLPVREFLYLKHLLHQEHPRSRVRMECQLYLGGEFANNAVLRDPMGRTFTVNDNQALFNRVDVWNQLNWYLEGIVAAAQQSFPDKAVDLRRILYIDDKPVHSYTVLNDNYFMMGDNRDNSADSRYWGYLNKNFIKAKAFILYFSLDKETPWYLLPMKIRWNRIGKLIRPWDGTGTDGGAH